MRGRLRCKNPNVTFVADVGITKTDAGRTDFWRTREAHIGQLEAIAFPRMDELSEVQLMLPRVRRDIFAELYSSSND